ncbi:MAG: transposase family protein [Sphaerochaetaceae bacterium]
MNPVWVGTAVVAELLGISERHVRNRLSLWEYRWREDRGRKVLEVNVRSLPKEASDRYILRTLPDLQAVVPERTGADDIETTLRAYERANNRAKRNYDKWAAILSKCEGISGSSELSRWVEVWNADHPGQRTSMQSIYRQRSLVAECGSMALINSRAILPSTVRDAWFDDFRQAYLTANKLSVPCARMIAFGYARERGEADDIRSFPSPSAFTRRLNREVSPDVIYYAREGKKKFYDNKGNYIERDYSDLRAGQVWVGDTRTWDVFVKTPEYEIPKTCYITLFLDFKSYMPMGWQLHVSSPGTENTLRALRNGIGRYGMPDEIYVDNGREYRNKDFSGQSRGHKIIEDEQYAESLAARLGLKMHFSIVRNARAKVIERQFLVIKNGFDRLFNSFKGGTVVEKPEPLKAVIKKGDILTFEEFAALADEYLKEVFPGLPCSGKIHRGKSRAALWNEEIARREPMRRLTEDTLAMLTSRTVCGRITATGFRIAALETVYWAEWMPVRKGREITVRYDPDDMRTAHAYESDGSFIGTCSLVEAVGAMVRDDDAVGKAAIAEGVARRRHEEKLLKELVPEMTRTQAADYIHALKAAVATPDVSIPEGGAIALTRHDADASAIAKDAKVGNPAIIDLIPPADAPRHRKLAGLYDEEPIAKNA